MLTLYCKHENQNLSVINIHLAQNNKSKLLSNKIYIGYVRWQQKRLRAYNMVGKTIHLSVRSSNREWFGKHSTLLYPTNSEQEIYEVCCILESMNWRRSTRLVGVSISNLQEEKSLTLKSFCRSH